MLLLKCHRFLLLTTYWLYFWTYALIFNSITSLNVFNTRTDPSLCHAVKSRSYQVNGKQVVQLHRGELQSQPNTTFSFFRGGKRNKETLETYLKKDSPVGEGADIFIFVPKPNVSPGVLLLFFVFFPLVEQMLRKAAGPEAYRRSSLSFMFRLTLMWRYEANTPAGIKEIFRGWIFYSDTVTLAEQCEGQADLFLTCYSELSDCRHRGKSPLSNCFYGTF